MKIVGEFSCDATHILVPLRQRQESHCPGSWCDRGTEGKGHLRNALETRAPGSAIRYEKG